MFSNFPLVSIIIPIYNAQQYLKKCISSVCYQTYTNLEIILVDDGSKDDSAIICNKFSKKDKRIRTYNRENRGVSSARNFGISESKGEYIFFLDSDDWLPRCAIQKLVEGILKNNADICYGDTRLVGVFNEKSAKKTKTLYFEGKDNFLMIRYMDNMYPGPCAKLYKANIIKNLKEQFPLGVKYGEDTIFLYRYLQKCNIFASIHDSVYFYNQMNINSASRKQYEQIGDWLLNQIEELRNIFSSENLSDTEKQYLGDQLYKTYEMASKHYLQNFSKDKGLIMLNNTQEKFVEFLNNNMMESICGSDGINIKEKITKHNNGRIIKQKHVFYLPLIRFVSAIKKCLIFQIKIMN